MAHYVCAYHYTQLSYTTAQNNFPSYPPDNHYSSDDVYWRGGELRLMVMALVTSLYVDSTEPSDRLRVYHLGV